MNEKTPAPLRLNATFVIMDTGPQEALVRTILGDLGHTVVSQEMTDLTTAFAVFVNPKPLKKRTRLSGTGRTVRFARVIMSRLASCTLEVKMPEWSAGALGFVALNPLLEEDLAKDMVLLRLKDALRASARLCTQRLRQQDFHRRCEEKRKLLKSAQAVSA